MKRASSVVLGIGVPLIVVVSWCASRGASADGRSDSEPATAPSATAPSAAVPSAAEPEEETLLPWNRPLEDEVQPPTPRLSSAREMLDLYSIDASQIRQLEDGVPLAMGEEETLFKILFRMPFFGKNRVQAWCRRDVDWAELAEYPEDWRLEVFPLVGRVTQVQRLEVPPETAARLEFGSYFQVRLQLDNAPYPVLICSRAVPEAWESADSLDEPASCYGLFLKTGGKESGHTELVFAAERVAWLPQRADPGLGITPDVVYLASLGMDAGLFDVVRTTNRRAMTADDRESFYQLLAAMGRADPADVFARAEASPDLAPMLIEPEGQHGRLVSLLGTAKRVQRIAVEEPDLQERFGIDHYYQIDLFVSLGDTEIRFEQKDGGEPAVFQHNYPVTCCVLRLPASLPARDDIAVPVRFAGAYFKLWAYRSEYMATLDDRQRQVSPLFIATTPRVVRFDDSASQLVGWIGGITVLVLILLAGFYTWYPRASDRRFEQQVLRPRLELGGAKSLDELDLPTQDKPDFSGLAARDRGSSSPEPGETES